MMSTYQGREREIALNGVKIERETKRNEFLVRRAKRVCFDLKGPQEGY